MQIITTQDPRSASLQSHQDAQLVPGSRSSQKLNASYIPSPGLGWVFSLTSVDVGMVFSAPRGSNWFKVFTKL